MTERWQKQLGKLRAVEPPADSWQRTETRPPSGDGFPPPRQRIVAGIVAFGVFAAAGAFGWTAFRPSGSTTGDAEGQAVQLEVRLQAAGSWTDGHKSSATMTVDGQPVAVRSGGERYTVSDVSGEVMVDPVEFVDTEYVVLDPGSSMSVSHDADRVEAAVVADAKDKAGMPVDLADSTPFGEVPAGRWLLRIDARWQEGQIGWVGNGWRLDARYFFPIELTAPSAIPIVLAGTEWRLTAIDDEPIDENADRLWGASIAFEGRSFAGWSGCNSFGGKYGTDGSAFDVGSIGGTQVGPCSGEQAWFERLQAADSWTSDGGMLEVAGPAGSFTAVRVGVSPVDVLRVECLPGRTQILDPEVVATAVGVDAVFGPGGHAKHVVFLSSEGEVVSMAGLDDRASDTTVQLAPGNWSVRCVGWGEDIASAELTVFGFSEALGTTETSAAEPTASDRLELTCGPDQPEGVTPRVIAQEDGLHLIVTDAAGDTVLVMFTFFGDSQLESGVTDIGAETSIALGPGIHEVWCGSGPGPFTTAEFQFRQFEIVDPLRVFDDPELSCPSSDRLVLSEGAVRDVAARPQDVWITRAIEGVRESDSVVRVGYAEESSTGPLAWFEIQREGQTVGWVHVGPRWFYEGEACVGSGIGGA